MLLRVRGGDERGHRVAQRPPVATHLGGYLPFTIALTERLRFGAENRIEIKLDNRDNRITGPKPLKDLDFNTYGGLYRGAG